jgi:hypothetical protein
MLKGELSLPRVVPLRSAPFHEEVQLLFPNIGLRMYWERFASPVGRPQSFREEPAWYGIVL